MNQDRFYPNWIPKRILPHMDDGEEWEYQRTSIPVLGLYNYGKQAVVTCSQSIDEYGVDGEGNTYDEEPRWHTEDSECWDVTDEIIAWMPLPPVNKLLIKSLIEDKI